MSLSKQTLSGTDHFNNKGAAELKTSIIFKSVAFVTRVSSASKEIAMSDLGLVSETWIQSY